MPGTRPSFRSPAARDGFAAAYEAMLARWPVPYDVCELPSEFGRTQVLSSGPPDAPPVVLLHGGGSTSTVWWNTVAALARAHRVHAVDHIGDLGRSVNDGRPLKTVDDLLTWLDGVVDGLGPDRVAVVGHSYGAWQALTWALRARQRVTRLVLIDPTDCFVGMPTAYKLRSLPVLLAPSRRRWRSFLAWETGGAALDPQWVDLIARNGEVRAAWPVMPKRPAADRLRALDVPTLVVLAERSRAVEATTAARVASDTLPDVRTTVLTGQTHHTLPAHDAAALNAALVGFLS